jgi:hypothetical protein
LILVCVAAPAALVFCARQETRVDRQVENLRTFAKLYGYVRFFHPSEEADAVDWDRLAIYGAGRVKKASSREELLGILRELFRPIAPTARIHATGSEPPPVRLMPRDTTGLTPVAWQHLGVGLGGTGSIYSSKRLNRTAEVVVSAAGVFTQAVEAAPYRGMPVRLRAFVRVDVPADGGQSQLWLRVDRSGGRQHGRSADHLEPMDCLRDRWNRGR